MSEELKNLRVAVLATNGFEQAELTEPVKALHKKGATVDIVSLPAGEIQGIQHRKRATTYPPGGLWIRPSPRTIRRWCSRAASPTPTRCAPIRARSASCHFFDAKKPIAAICQGPWTLIEADAVRGKQVTSWPSLKTDLKNAGAEWIDREVVVDHGLVTSRKRRAPAQGRLTERSPARAVQRNNERRTEPWQQQDRRKKLRRSCTSPRKAR
jgi:deglycase